MDFAVEVDRDDGDPGGEASHRLAKVSRIQVHLSCICATAYIITLAALYHSSQP